MATSFMISNRKWSKKDFLGAERDKLRFFVSDQTGGALSDPDSWQERTLKTFSADLIGVASSFPVLADAQNEDQKHVTLFVHGYNVSWVEAAQRYADIQQNLYSGPSGLGALILFSWPSNGNVASYLPDREDARDSGPDLSDVLVSLHDYLIAMQRTAAVTKDVEKFCKAKFSMIAHSMGNYVTQKTLAITSRKLNNPQLVTLIHQLVMVAADVDNDLFQKANPPDSDGSLMANLCYRIAAFYTGTDQVLGASAGLKHFGTRRLGRSGLADRTQVYDNVFDLDVTSLLDPEATPHSAVFDSPKAVDLLRKVLRGVDRTLLP